jgi:hypothetical protein
MALFLSEGIPWVNSKVYPGRETRSSARQVL